MIEVGTFRVVPERCRVVPEAFPTLP